MPIMVKIASATAKMLLTSWPWAGSEYIGCLKETDIDFEFSLRRPDGTEIRSMP